MFKSGKLWLFICEIVDKEKSATVLLSIYHIYHDATHFTGNDTCSHMWPLQQTNHLLFITLHTKAILYVKHSGLLLFIWICFHSPFTDQLSRWPKPKHFEETHLPINNQNKMEYWNTKFFPGLFNTGNTISRDSTHSNQTDHRITYNSNKVSP